MNPCSSNVNRYTNLCGHIVDTDRGISCVDYGMAPGANIGPDAIFEAGNVPDQDISGKGSATSLAVVLAVATDDGHIDRPELANV